MDQQFLERYRCPACRGELNRSDDGIRCESCSIDYSLRDDYTDFLTTEESASTAPLTDHLFRWVSPIYDSLYFPLLYWLGTLPDTYTPGAHAEKLVERTTTQQGVVLDVACGTGRLTRELGRVNKTVYGLDRSRGMLRQAVCSRSDELEHTITFCRGDAFELPFGSRTFDAVTCSGAFYFFTELKPALDEIHRVLNPGGYVAGMSVVPEGILGNRLSRWVLKAYQSIGTYVVRTVDDLGKELTRTGFTSYQYDRYGAVLLFHAHKK